MYGSGISYFSHSSRYNFGPGASEFHIWAQYVEVNPSPAEPANLPTRASTVGPVPKKFGL